MAVAVPTLTFADAADGSGGTLTIAGSTGGATNTAYIQPLDSAWYGDTGWQSKGSRTGDGDITIACSAGQYMGYVLSTSGVESNVSLPLMFRASNTSESVYYKCLTAVQTRLRLLELNEVNNSNIIILKQSLLRTLGSGVGKLCGFPAILISKAQTAETLNPDGGTNARDDIGYPVNVAMIRQVNTDPEFSHLNEDDVMMLWRERIRKAFVNQGLPGATGVYRGVVEMREPNIGILLGDGLEGSAMTLRFFSRETRGLT